MSEKRFKSFRAVNNHYCIKDRKTKKEYDVPSKEASLTLVDLLNQLWEENEQLRQTIKEMQQDEQLYANEILELREANKEFIQFKELGGDY